MNKRRILTPILATATLLAGFGVLRVEAQDNPPQPPPQNQQQNQQQPPPQNQQRGGNGFQNNRPVGPNNIQRLNNRNGQQANPVAVSNNERMRRAVTNDPSRSAVNYLLTRNDVRSELAITTRQREQLEELNRKAPAQMMDKFRNSEIIREIQERSRQIRELPESERRAQSEQMRQEMKQRGDQILTELQGFQSDLDKHAEEILTPAQRKRLRELDLQFRGGLALSDSKLAEELAMTPDQTQEVARLMQEFRQKQGQLTAEAMGFGERNQNGDPNNPNATNAGNNPVQATPRNTQPNKRQGTTGNNTNRQGGNQVGNGQVASGKAAADARGTEDNMKFAQVEIDGLRKELGNKALQVFNADQWAYWKSILGRPFTFRVVD